MDATIASLIGTAIGALVGLAGGFLTSRQQTRLEYLKWVRTKEDEYEKEVRLAVAKLTKKLAAGTQAISWFTSKAQIEPAKLTENDLLAYDNTIQALYLDIVSSRIVVAALNKEIHAKMTPLVDELYSLDIRVAKAAALFRNSQQQEGIKELANCSDITSQFEDELIERVTEIIGSDKTIVKSRRK